MSAGEIGRIRAEMKMLDALKEAASFPPGTSAPFAQASAAAALDHIEWLQRGVAEWRAMALAAQAQVKHQSGQRESELVTLLKDIHHCSDMFATFRPDLHARLLDFGRRLKAQEPKDDFPEDYEVN